MANDLKLIQTGETAQGMRVYAYVQGGTVQPQADQIVTGKEWVPLGKDNKFLKRMLSLMANTVPLAQSVRMNALYLAGRGVVITKKGPDGKMVPHEEAIAKYKEWTNKQGETEFRTRTMFDVAFANARVWHDRYDSEGNLTVLAHLDVTSVRSGTPNIDSKKVEQYFVSANWDKADARVRNSAIDYTPVPYPRYNPDKRNASAVKLGQLEYAFQYLPDQPFYGIPFWLSCVPDAYNWSKIPQMYQADIDTGFSAQVWVHFEGKLTPAQQLTFDRDMQKIHTGARGKRLLTSTGSPGEKLTITPIPSNALTGEREAIREAAKLEIVNANSIPPILAGIDVKVGMSGQAPAIPQQWQRYVKTFIEPLQDLYFERPLLERLKRAGFMDIAECYIEVFSPFDEVADEVQQRQAYLRTTTRNEHRTLVQKLPALVLEDGKTPDPRGNELLIETPGGGGAPADPNAV